jgi:uncharacterized protein (TIGR02147 family)
MDKLKSVQSDAIFSIMKRNLKTRKNIEEYLDYREFLSDELALRKKTVLGFSYRSISQKAGFHSSGFLSGVLSAKRNLTEETMHALAAALRLTPQQHEYFTALVNYNQAKQIDRKRYYLEKCLGLSVKGKNAKTRMLQRNQYEVFSAWYNAALRELAAIFPIKKREYPDAAGMLIPSITPQQAKESLELLLRLGLLKENTHGELARPDKLLSAPCTPWSLVAVHDFQAAMMRLAIDSLQRFNKEERDISTLTVSVDADACEVMKKLIARFRATILQVAGSVARPDRICQLNVQLFPLTKVIERKDRS